MDLKKLSSLWQERIDVHSELYDVRTAAIKTLKKRIQQKKTKPGSTLR
jgi:hypothetical protein